MACVDEHCADGGQLDGTGPAGAVEHPLTEHPLKAGDLLADGRLAEPEPVGGAAERPFGGHGLEGLEVADLDVVEANRLHK